MFHPYILPRNILNILFDLFFDTLIEMSLTHETR